MGRGIFVPRFALTILIGLFSTSLLWGDTVEEYFQQLKDKPEHYIVFGTVCEQVGRLILIKSYPTDTYKIVSGIQYFLNGMTLGELDLVVFRKDDKEAILIAEVKCWKDLPSALKKAHSQLSRFEHYSNGKYPIELLLQSDKKKVFQLTQFDELPEFITIAQDGAEEVGFDMALDISLAEAADLRAQLLEAQGH